MYPVHTSSISHPAGITFLEMFAIFAPGKWLYYSSSPSLSFLCCEDFSRGHTLHLPPHFEVHSFSYLLTPFSLQNYPELCAKRRVRGPLIRGVRH